MGKIGIVSDDPIRISVYEMLQNLTKAVSTRESWALPRQLRNRIFDELGEER